MGIEREKRLGLHGLTPEQREVRMKEIRAEAAIFQSPEYRAAERAKHEAKVARLTAQGVTETPKFGWRPDKKDVKQPWMESATKD